MCGLSTCSVELTGLGSLPGPLVSLGLVAPQHRLGTDHAPGAHCHHGFRDARLGGVAVKVQAERRVAGTGQDAVLVGLAHAQAGLWMAEFRGAGEELRGVGLVFEDVVAVAVDVQGAELKGPGVVLRVGRLAGALEPLDALAPPVARKAEVVGEAGSAEARRSARVALGGRLAVELHGLGVVGAAAPAVLVAQRGAVAGLGVAVLGGRDEERKGALVVRSSIVEEAGREAVGEVVLRQGVAAQVGQSLQDLLRFSEQFGAVGTLGRVGAHRTFL